MFNPFGHFILFSMQGRAGDPMDQPPGNQGGSGLWVHAACWARSKGKASMKKYDKPGLLAEVGGGELSMAQPCYMFYFLRLVVV